MHLMCIKSADFGQQCPLGHYVCALGVLPPPPEGTEDTVGSTVPQFLHQYEYQRSKDSVIVGKESES